MSAELSSVNNAVRRRGDLLALILLAATCFQTWFCFGDFAWYAENNLFELSQDALLASGGGLFFIAASLADDRVSRLSLLALTLFCLSILFREIDVRGTNLEPWLNNAFQHRWHYGFLGLLWTTVIGLSLRHFRLSVAFTLRWLFGWPGALMVAGILFYVLGDFAEKHVFTGDGELSEMVEESLEQFGTLFICFSAWATLRRL